RLPVKAPCQRRNVIVFLEFISTYWGVMARSEIPIDWEALETAVERNSPDTEGFLEKSSGNVLTIVKGDPEAGQLKARVAANIDAYIRVEPASSREQYRWMERF